eukprot:9173330-Heterocapsa_arctica.AAC.1
MARNYNSHTTFNTASFNFVITCLEMMDPDQLARDRIMSTGYEAGIAPNKQQLLDIFEFCTDIHRNTLVGNFNTTSITFAREVKEALITLVTTYRSLGSRAT